MEIITAEQAIEAAKGLTFEKVWAALMESRLNMEESHRRMDERFEKRMEETQKQIEETQKQMKETQKQMGKLGNSLGRFTEAMFSAKLCDKFNELGYVFNTQANHKKLYENRVVLAEADSILENGEYVMIVEIKTSLSVDDVDEFLEKMAVIRRYMDGHGDNRKLVGAVAGGVVHESELRYAQKKGFFVLVQNGDSVDIAAAPLGFQAREW